MTPRPTELAGVALMTPGRVVAADRAGVSPPTFQADDIDAWSLKVLDHEVIRAIELLLLP